MLGKRVVEGDAAKEGRSRSGEPVGAAAASQTSRTITPTPAAPSSPSHDAVGADAGAAALITKLQRVASSAGAGAVVTRTSSSSNSTHRSSGPAVLPDSQEAPQATLSRLMSEAGAAVAAAAGTAAEADTAAAARPQALTGTAAQDEASCRAGTLCSALEGTCDNGPVAPPPADSATDGPRVATTSSSGYVSRETSNSSSSSGGGGGGSGGVVCSSNSGSGSGGGSSINGGSRSSTSNGDGGGGGNSGIRRVGAVSATPAEGAAAAMVAASATAAAAPMAGTAQGAPARAGIGTPGKAGSRSQIASRRAAAGFGGITLGLLAPWWRSHVGVGVAVGSGFRPRVAVVAAFVALAVVATAVVWAIGQQTRFEAKIVARGDRRSSLQHDSSRKQADLAVDAKHGGLLLDREATLEKPDVAEFYSNRSHRERSTGTHAQGGVGGAGGGSVGVGGGVDGGDAADVSSSSAPAIALARHRTSSAGSGHTKWSISAAAGGDPTALVDGAGRGSTTTGGERRGGHADGSDRGEDMGAMAEQGKGELQVEIVKDVGRVEAKEGGRKGEEKQKERKQEEVGNEKKKQGEGWREEAGQERSEGKETRQEEGQPVRKHEDDMQKNDSQKEGTRTNGYTDGKTGKVEDFRKEIRPDGAMRGERQNGRRGVGHHRRARHSLHSQCDLYSGRWVRDRSRPLYDGKRCAWLAKNWACRLSRERPNFEYEKMRWQPAGCDVPRFDPPDFLRRLANQTVAFFGDSLGQQQFQSLLCLLAPEGPTTNSSEASSPSPSPTSSSSVWPTEVADDGDRFGFYLPPGARRPTGWAYRFVSSNTTLLFKWTTCLCRIDLFGDTSSPSSSPSQLLPPPPSSLTSESNQKKASAEVVGAMHLDRVDPFLEENLHRFSVVVLNSGHHWNRVKLKGLQFHVRGVKAPLVKGRLMWMGQAHYILVSSLSHWANTRLHSMAQQGHSLLHSRGSGSNSNDGSSSSGNSSHSALGGDVPLVLLRTMSPRHFMQGEWDSGGRCDHIQKPLNESQLRELQWVRDEGTENAYQGVPDPALEGLDLTPQPQAGGGSNSNSNGSGGGGSHTVAPSAPSFRLLNVTYMSAYRGDAHPAKWDFRGVSNAGQDCLHWCLPGVPDVWNELLYANLVLHQAGR